MRPYLVWVAAACVLGTATSVAAIPFAIETVDETATSVCCMDLQVDPTGTSHLVFQALADATGGNLVYAVRDGAAWQRARTFVGTSASLALDRSNRPHLSYNLYQGATAGSLHYATLTADGWRLEMVDGNQVRFWSSIALDSADEPLIAYMKWGTAIFPNESYVFLGRRVDGSWVPGPRHLAMPVRISLAIGPSDVPQVAFPNQAGNGSRPTMLRWVQGAWTEERLEPITAWFNPGPGLSRVRLESDGTAHFALVEIASQDIWYATRGPAGWIYETVATAEQARHPALALDATGTPHVTFHDVQRSELIYARREGGVWTAQVIETGVTGGASAIALDLDGNPHIAYRVGPALDPGPLRYAVGRLHARATAFVTGGDRTIQLADRRPTVCLQVQSQNGNFDLSEVDLSRIALTRQDGVGGSAPATDAAIDRDRDRDGVPEIRACFDKPTYAGSLRLQTVADTGPLDVRVYDWPAVWRVASACSRSNPARWTWRSTHRRRASRSGRGSTLPGWTVVVSRASSASSW